MECTFRTAGRVMTTLTVASHRHDPFLVMKLTGELQHATAEDAEAEILAAIAMQTGPPHLVLDLTGVGFLDAGGIDLLARARTAVRAHNGTLRLVATPHGRPRYVLRLTSLDEAIPVSDTLTHALTTLDSA